MGVTSGEVIATRFLRGLGELASIWLARVSTALSESFSVTVCTSMGVVSGSFSGCPFSCSCAGGIGRGILKSWGWNVGDRAGSELAVSDLCWLCFGGVTLGAGWVKTVTAGPVRLVGCGGQGCESDSVCSYGVVFLVVVKSGVCLGVGTSRFSVDAEGLSFCWIWFESAEG